MQWHIKHMGWFMVQWGWPILFSLGIHIDRSFKYIDFHLVFIIITIGSPDWPYKEYRAWWSSRSIT